MGKIIIKIKVIKTLAIDTFEKCASWELDESRIARRIFK